MVPSTLASTTGWPLTCTVIIAPGGTSPTLATLTNAAMRPSSMNSCFPLRGAPGLKEDANVLRQEHVLVEDDFAMGDLPGVVDLPEDVLSPAHVEVLLGLPPVAVNDEVGVDLHL